MDRRADLAVALAVLSMGVVILVIAGDIRPTGPVVDPIGPRGFPYLIGGVFTFAGAILSFTRLRALRADGPWSEESDGEPDEPRAPASAVQAWSIMAAATVYVLTLDPLGYILTTPIFVAVALAVMGIRSLPVIAATAIGYTALTYVVFAIFMRVILPLGPLAPLFRALGLAR